jgi:hypothetical protein
LWQIVGLIGRISWGSAFAVGMDVSAFEVQIKFGVSAIAVSREQLDRVTVHYRQADLFGTNSHLRAK